jgi:hypothetical protein
MTTTKDWRDDVFVSRICYIFQGNMFCEDCDNKILKRLSHKQLESEDSNDCPQGPYVDGGGEADTPYFCGSGSSCTNKVLVPSPTNVSIGCPLGNPLTWLGVKEVNDTIRSAAFDRGTHARAYARLLQRLYGQLGHNILTDELVEVQFAGLTELPEELQAALKKDKTGGGKSTNKLCVDTENLYYVSRGKSGNAVVGKIPLTPSGGYGSPQLVMLPGSELKERTPTDIIRACIDDVAWE